MAPDQDDHNIVDLSHNGGIATVILAPEFNLPADYDLHPQVFPIISSELPSSVMDIDRKLPSTTKIVLIGGTIPATKFGFLRTVLTRRRLAFVIRRSEPALRDALSKCLPDRSRPAQPPVERQHPPQPHPEPLTSSIADAAKLPKPTNHPDFDAPVQAQAANQGKNAPKGSISSLVQECADLNKGSAEEARRLFRIAQSRGIPTTLGSLAQAITVQKRKGGRTEPPKSILTEQQRAVGALTDAIINLELVKEYVERTETLNLELTAKLNAFKALLKD